MSSIGSGYDQAVSTFSPDGRIFQVYFIQCLFLSIKWLFRSNMLWKQLKIVPQSLVFVVPMELSWHPKNWSLLNCICQEIVQESSKWVHFYRIEHQKQKQSFRLMIILVWSAPGYFQMLAVLWIRVATKQITSVANSEDQFLFHNFVTMFQDFYTHTQDMTPSGIYIHRHFRPPINC